VGPIGSRDRAVTGRSKAVAATAVAVVCFGVLVGVSPAVGFWDTTTTKLTREADASAAAAASCARFAAPWGREGQPGTRERPVKTVQRLVDRLRPGETGCLRGGLYESGDGYLLNVSRGGVTLRSYPGELARLRGIVQVRNGADGFRLDSLVIEGTGDANTIKVYSADFVLEDSEVTNAYRGQSCMILGSSSGGAAVRPVIRRNRFHECGSPDNDNHDHAIYAHTTRGGEIVGNLFYNHIARAIQLYPDAQQMLVARNVIDGAAPSIRGGIGIGGDSERASNGNIVERNIIAYAVHYNIYTNWGDLTGSNNIVRSNCLWAGGLGNTDLDEGAVESANVAAPPAFVNRRARDYRLRSGSGCRRLVGSTASWPFLPRQR
jgi:hypothetical protein